MHPVLAITGIVVILAVLPAIWRLMDEPIDWSRYSLPHHAARLARRAAARYRARRATPPAHEHQWHHIAACRGCGAVVRETSAP